MAKKASGSSASPSSIRIENKAKSVRQCMPLAISRLVYKGKDS